MIIQNVPFYPNHKDATHCYQACLKMMLKYFLPDRDFSWKELEEITDKKEGKPTWAMRGLMNLQKMGFDVKQITNFDQKAFAEKGLDFLKDRYGEEYAKLESERSDILAEQKTAQEFVKTGIAIQRVPTFADIEQYIDKGYLVICLVNDGQHYILVYGYDKDHIYFHNPGLNGQEVDASRAWTRERHAKGWTNSEGEFGAIQAFKLAKSLA
jgi:hypothetical protein